MNALASNDWNIRTVEEGEKEEKKGESRRRKMDKRKRSCGAEPGAPALGERGAEPLGPSPSCLFMTESLCSDPSQLGPFPVYMNSFIYSFSQQIFM